MKQIILMCLLLTLLGCDSGYRNDIVVASGKSLQCVENLLKTTNIKYSKKRAVPMITNEEYHVVEFDKDSLPQSVSARQWLSACFYSGYVDIDLGDRAKYEIQHILDYRGGEVVHAEYDDSRKTLRVYYQD